MKTSYGASAKYKRQIKVLARIRRGQEATHERIFIDNAIAALKDDEPIEAITNLKYCFNSVNLKGGENLEKVLKKDDKCDYCNEANATIYCLNDKAKFCEKCDKHETIVGAIVTAVKAIYEKFLSIYLNCNEYRDHRRTTSQIIKSFS